MASPAPPADADVTYHCKFFQIHKDGTVKVHHPNLDRADPPPPSKTQYRDVVVSEKDNITARIFLPEIRPGSSPDKLPIIVYFHGGGFCMFSPYHPRYHRYCANLAEDTAAIVVSVDYGLFPDRPIPACYDDSWAALKWVASHGSGSVSKPDPWLAEYGDFNKVFIAGDSAGGNICHTLAYRVGSEGLDGVKLIGAILFHPFFGGTEDDWIWMKMCPTNSGLDDPRINPGEANLARLGVEKVLIFVAEKDHLCDPGKRYYEKLKRSGWKGTAEIVENLDREHCFHVFQEAEDEQVADMRRRVAAFVRGV
ncbi:unnamed protein product [Rhodiola kirilowii]